MSNPSSTELFNLFPKFIVFLLHLALHGVAYGPIGSLVEVYAGGAFAGTG